MERYRVEKVVGEGSFGKAILCARIRDNKVKTSCWDIGSCVAFVSAYSITLYIRSISRSIALALASSLY